MDIKKLKLQLIQRVLQTNDGELLQTALKVLQLGSRQAFSFPTLPGEEPPVLQQGDPPQDEEVKQLQRDIDELFNP